MVRSWKATPPKLNETVLNSLASNYCTVGRVAGDNLTVTGISFVEFLFTLGGHLPMLAMVLSPATECRVSGEVDRRFRLSSCNICGSLTSCTAEGQAW